jgi:hypothetical protein
MSGKMLATDCMCAHLIRMMDVTKILYELERAWQHALPGRESLRA